MTYTGDLLGASFCSFDCDLLVLSLQDLLLDRGRLPRDFLDALLDHRGWCLFYGVLVFYPDQGLDVSSGCWPMRVRGVLAVAAENGHKRRGRRRHRWGKD